MWAGLNPTHIPKEVEAVVLETTALNCSCTLNVHERDGHEGIQQMFCRKQKNIIIFFLHRKAKGCSDCGRNSSSSNWNYTLKH